MAAPYTPTFADLDRRFDYHAPNDETRVKHQAARDAMKTAAYAFADLLPDGREKSLVYTKLEEAMFWANAAIARENAE